MSNVLKKAVDFLLAYEMDVESIDFDHHISLFLEQMERGLTGSESSLEMIPTYMHADNAVPVHERVIVADAGGTNFRVATVTFDEQKQPMIENLQKFSMPAIDRELSSGEFFEAMAEYFRDVIDASDKIGFCFSYPVEIMPNKDGRVIRFAKEIKAPEVVGQLVNENLNAAFAKLGLSSGKKIVLMNDTVATLLAGVDFQNRDFSSYVGFILGTGTNCSYVESNANITKVEGLDVVQNQIINTESGGMDVAHQGRIDMDFDASTNNPGVHKFEKMISGAYLGSLFLTAAKQAAANGLLTAETAGRLSQMTDLETKDLNDFMSYPYDENSLAAICTGSEDDACFLYAIADRLIERAAKLTAINLSAMSIKSGCGTNPTRPICIIADGTTFYHMKTLRSRVEFYLKQYLENQRGIYTDIVHVESAPVVGAAIAGLTN